MQLKQGGEMSAIISGRVYWTEFKALAYQNKQGKTINIKETTAKIVMLAIADSADDFGENSWQSFETIATKASIERRSVIRVVRALIEHKYLTIAGLTKYGTNNFSVNKDLLGFPPAKRAKVGRPKTSDSDAEIGDSESETSDHQSPDPLIKPSITPAKRGDALDGIIRYQLKPQSIRQAFADFFKLTPNWEAKYNRQFLEWSVETGVTPEQVQHAARVWGKDKRFNWAAPNLKGIQEHWLELIENIETGLQSLTDQPDQGWRNGLSL
jgi:hypothetical protein